MSLTFPPMNNHATIPGLTLGKKSNKSKHFHLSFAIYVHYSGFGLYMSLYILHALLVDFDSRAEL